MNSEVVCRGCGIVRIAVIDQTETEKECVLTTKFPCKACGCPYVELKEELLKEKK